MERLLSLKDAQEKIICKPLRVRWILFTDDTDRLNLSRSLQVECCQSRRLTPDTMGTGFDLSPG